MSGGYTPSGSIARGCPRGGKVSSSRAQTQQHALSQMNMISHPTPSNWWMACWHILAKTVSLVRVYRNGHLPLGQSELAVQIGRTLSQHPGLSPGQPRRQPWMLSSDSEVASDDITGSTSHLVYWLIPITVKGIDILVLIDTGASATMMDSRCTKTYN